eukprot:GEMP01007753.1.p1 GENE.GEMP01007753.1~~GEMP01007753.1.p1  ORF type:complete len:482 (+),score=111.58 GEMP01007753.1:334-1779(+)
MIDVVNEDVDTTNQLRPGSDVMFQSSDIVLSEGDVVAFDVRKRPDSRIYHATNVTKLEGLDAKVSKMENLAENKLSLGYSTNIVDLALTPLSHRSSEGQEGEPKMLPGRLSKSRLLTLKAFSSGIPSNMGTNISPTQSLSNSSQCRYQARSSRFEQMASFAKAGDFEQQGQSHDSMSSTAHMWPHVEQQTPNVMQQGNFGKGGKSAAPKVQILLQKPPFMENFDLAEIANCLIQNKPIQHQYGFRYTVANAGSEAAMMGKEMAYMLLQAKEQLEREDNAVEQSDAIMSQHSTQQQNAMQSAPNMNHPGAGQQAVMNNSMPMHAGTGVVMNNQMAMNPNAVGQNVMAMNPHTHAAMIAMQQGGMMTMQQQGGQGVPMTMQQQPLSQMVQQDWTQSGQGAFQNGQGGWFESQNPGNHFSGSASLHGDGNMNVFDTPSTEQQTQPAQQQQQSGDGTQQQQQFFMRGPPQTMIYYTTPNVSSEWS